MALNQIYKPVDGEIVRYLSGEMEPEEQLVFAQKLQHNQELYDEFLEIAKAWELAGIVSKFQDKPLNTQAAWEKLSSRIDNPEVIAVEIPVKIRRMPVPSQVKWAAALLITLGLGWLAYLAWSPPADLGLIVFDNPTQDNTMVKMLNDGSVVYLSAASQVEYPPVFSVSERNVVMKGEAFFDVAPHPEKPFRIKAGKTSIEVVGTSFNVKSETDNHMELFVETGMVRVTSSRIPGKSFTVEPGQLLEINNGKATLTIPGNYNTTWRKNMLSFRDEKLENIFHVIGKTYGYTLMAEGEPLKNRIMTLTISENSLRQISEMLALSLGADFELRNDTIALFRNR